MTDAVNATPALPQYQYTYPDAQGMADYVYQPGDFGSTGLEHEYLRLGALEQALTALEGFGDLGDYVEYHADGQTSVGYNGLFGERGLFELTKETAGADNSFNLTSLSHLDGRAAQGIEAAQFLTSPESLAYLKEKAPELGLTTNEGNLLFSDELIEKAVQTLRDEQSQFIFGAL